jgi:hypothetical protein
MPASPAHRRTAEDAARAIVDGAARGKLLVNPPGDWRLIMIVIRQLPSLMLNRMNI